MADTTVSDNKVAEAEPDKEESAVNRVVLDSFDDVDIAKAWSSQDKYIDMLERRLKQLEERGRSETSSRERLLVFRLSSKEQELQELTAQITELKSAQSPSQAELRQTLLDPAVNILIEKLTKECDKLKKDAEEAQNELAAWKFTPDSGTGKRLMAKCRQLYQENEELGKMISSGRLAKLEGELSLQKKLTQEMKKNQAEMDEFMAELDDDMEGMQGTIYFLQQQLRDAKDTIAKLEAQLGEHEKTSDKLNEESSVTNDEAQKGIRGLK